MLNASSLTEMEINNVSAPQTVLVRCAIGGDRHCAGWLVLANTLQFKRAMAYRQPAVPAKPTNA
jgi:hypothetical protein